MTKLFYFLALLICGVGPSFAAESSTYNFSWLDPEKEVYVLQNRKFRKKRRVFISGGGGMGLSGSFVDSRFWQARAGFFFGEEYGLGFLYSHNFGTANEAADTLDRNDIFPFRRLVKNYRGALFLWSPFYSKTNFFNKIFYYDFIIGLGVAELNEVNNAESFELYNGRKVEGADITDRSESHRGPLIDLEIKFYITKWINLSLNANAVFYQAKNGHDTDTVWYHNWDLGAHLGFML